MAMDITKRRTVLRGNPKFISALLMAAALVAYPFYNVAQAVDGLAAPTNLRFGNPALQCGSVTSTYAVTPMWDAADGAVKYEYWVTTPGAHSTTPWTTLVTGTSYPGAFTEGEGAYTFKVRGVSSDNRYSEWSQPCVITYDKTAPSAPSLVSPTNNAYVNGATLTNSWSVVPGANHYVYESFNDGSATSLRWRQTLSETSKSATNVADSTFWWRVKAVDAAGNESGWSPLWKVTVDSTAPIASITAPASTEIVRGITAITGVVDSRETNMKSHWFEITGPNNYVEHFYDLNSSANSRSFDWDTNATGNPAKDGVYKIRYVATDKAGNRSDGPNYTNPTIMTVTVRNPVPVVNAEDFGVGSWTVAEHGFTGINVGFNIQDFQTVSGITVDVYNKQEKQAFATNTATPALLNQVNTAGWEQLSAPFAVGGTLVDTGCDGGPCWSGTSGVWNRGHVPLTAVITVAGTDIAGRTVTKTAINENFSEAAGKFADLVPTLPQPARESAAPTLPAQASARATTVLGVRASTLTQSASVVEDTVREGTTETTTIPSVLSATSGVENESSIFDSTEGGNTEESAFDLASYWWGVLPVGALGAGGWWLVAARRRNNE